MDGTEWLRAAPLLVAGTPPTLGGWQPRRWRDLPCADCPVLAHAPSPHCPEEGTSTGGCPASSPDHDRDERRTDRSGLAASDARLGEPALTSSAWCYPRRARRSADPSSVRR